MESYGFKEDNIESTIRIFAEYKDIDIVRKRGNRR